MRHKIYNLDERLKQFVSELPERLPKKVNIIDVYSAEENEKLIQYLASGAMCSRDTAICYLAFETGLRTVDICKIKISDIDWSRNNIHVVQAKTGRELNLDLRASYGNAMAEYVLNDRPKTSSDTLFLGKDAPYAPISSRVSYSILRNAANGAGIDHKGRIYGTRFTRHNAATRMLKKQIPIEDIAGVLGMFNSNSVMYYITTEDEQLSKCTLPLPAVRR